MTGRIKSILNFTFLAALVFTAPGAHAAAAKAPAKIPLEISGWIPYWRAATGTSEALVHLDAFKEVNPFGYTVKNDGTLADLAKMNEEPWTALIAQARERKIRVIPTLMWANTEAIHKILSRQKSRVALEDAVAALVKEKNFDGIDIDFEGKKAETKNYFSTFLKGLYQRLGSKKWLMCTIEARTPLDSRFDTIPQDIRYANDFAALGKYCDRVRFMTYDQGSIDLRLNEAAPGPYAPIADPKWVEKTIRLALKTISKNKIAIGAATYGYEYEVKPLQNGYRYKLLWAFNPKYALDLAQNLGIGPARNIAGELSFVYTPASSSAPAILSSAVATDTSLSNNVSLATTTFSQTASSTSPAAPFNLLWWSDGPAIKDKIALAKKLGVRGIAIFKIDGGADPGLWEALR